MKIIQRVQSLLKEDKMQSTQEAPSLEEVQRLEAAAEEASQRVREYKERIITLRRAAAAGEASATELGEVLSRAAAAEKIADGARNRFGTARKAHQDAERNARAAEVMEELRELVPRLLLALAELETLRGFDPKRVGISAEFAPSVAEAIFRASPQTEWDFGAPSTAWNRRNAKRC